MADSTTEFKPYIPADKITPEFTLTSILTGVILAIVFGPANAYLGLRVGMTISNSIPAAVIASNSIIVQEHGTLPYPEAQACAEVLFAGGLLAWFVMIPAIVVFGGDTVLFPSDISVAELYSAGGASAVWSKFIRYIGAGAHGMVSAITIGSIICIIAAIAGDTSQDLKTGYLLGATPKKQYRCLRLK